MTAQVYRAKQFEDSGVVLMNRIQGEAATNITQASVSAISYRVFECDTEDAKHGEEIGSSTSLTVSSVVFDTLQTDARWTIDSTGYNFRFTLPATKLPTGGRFYRVEVSFTPTSGEAFKAVWVVESLTLIGS